MKLLSHQFPIVPVSSFAASIQVQCITSTRVLRQAMATSVLHFDQYVAQVRRLSAEETVPAHFALAGRSQLESLFLDIGPMPGNMPATGGNAHADATGPAN